MQCFKKILTILKNINRYIYINTLKAYNVLRNTIATTKRAFLWSTFK